MNEQFLMKTFTWRVSCWLKTLGGVTSELYNISVQPSNLDHAPPLKELWSFFIFIFFFAAELISKDAVEMVTVNCISYVLPQAWSKLIFSELCVLNLDHHAGLSCKYCRKCRIQIPCEIQHQNK